MRLFLSRRTPPLPEAAERALQGVAASVGAGEQSAKERVRVQMLRRIALDAPLVEARKQVSLPAGSRVRVRDVILARIAPPVAGTVWDGVRSLLTPSAEFRQAVRGQLLTRLAPVPVRAASWHVVRWAAVGVFVLALVRVSPLLFIATPTRASSSVALVPSGDVSVLVSGFWEPVNGQIALSREAKIRTGKDGAATIIMHDDGVIRLAAETSVSLRDLSDRPDYLPLEPTLTLERGTLWAQGLMPETSSPGWDIFVPQGDVTVQEGSVSVALVAGGANVTVWDRLARVRKNDQDMTLVAGEAVALRPTSIAKLPTQSTDEDAPWVAANLRKDAVHRREIALLQQERRTRDAGITPDSTFYPVKRVAEAMDMLFTFGGEAKTQKRLAQAATRLNEAAVLLREGDTVAAEQTLSEYRAAVIAVASESGGTLAQTLVKRTLLAEVADVSAALPGDDTYLLKKTVLETTAAIPGSDVDPASVQGTVLVDTLSALTHKVQEGDVQGARDAFKKDVIPSLALTGESSPLGTDARKEARAALTLFANALQDEAKESGGEGIPTDLRGYLPIQEPPPVVRRALTDTEVDALVQQMYARIFLFKLQRSRYNQLLAEFRSIDGHPDQGRILRRLYHILPPNGLAQYVRTEFQRVRNEVQAEL